MSSKIDKRKKYFLVLDVETAGDVNKGHKNVYDLGYAISDKKGNVYLKRSFIVQEIFFNNELMETAYYKSKIKLYHKQISQGLHQVRTWKEIVKQFREDMLQYEPSFLSAYNLEFDISAMNYTNKNIGDKERIIPKELRGIQTFCIWGLACETIFKQPSYSHYANLNGWVSKAGNMRTNAEVAYRYITGNFNFIEEHTGLSDVLIEVKILAHCLRQNKKVSKGIIPNPWKIPNNRK